MRILGTGLSGTIGRFMPKDIIPIELDLSEDKVSFLNLDFQLSDTLIHLGGVVGNSLVEANQPYSRSVNVRGTQFLAEVFKEKSSGKFVHISTSHIYKPTNDKVNERSEIGPVSLYGSQKLEAEIILREIFSSMPNRLLIIRVFSILDWGGKSFTLSGAIAKLIDKRNPFDLFYVDDIRDFLTPNTVAQAVLTLARNSKANGVVNLCSGKGMRVEDAIVRMLTDSGFDVPRNNLKSGNSNIPVMVGDSGRIESLIHQKLIWTPSNYKINKNL